MGRKWGLVAAGLAVTAVAGCSSAGMHVSGAAPQVPSKPVVAVQQATPRVQEARMVTTSGRTAFRHWWVSGGYRQYEHVANDLSDLIIKDTLRDDDDMFYPDARRLIADATTARHHLPPVDRAGYRAAMTELTQAGHYAVGGSYDKAYLDIKAALRKLAAFNNAISAWDTSAPPASSPS